jgi:hypothetical protein
MPALVVQRLFDFSPHGINVMKLPPLAEDQVPVSPFDRLQVISYCPKRGALPKCEE